MIYVGDVTAQVAALASAIASVPDFEAATVGELTALKTVARVTADLIDTKIAQIDPSVAGDGATVASVAAGTFPLDALTTLNEVTNDLGQLSALMDASAYAGRIEINLKQATG